MREGRGEEGGCGAERGKAGIPSSVCRQNAQISEHLRHRECANSENISIPDEAAFI